MALKVNDLMSRIRFVLLVLFFVVAPRNTGCLLGFVILGIEHRRQSTAIFAARCVGNEKIQCLLYFFKKNIISLYIRFDFDSSCHALFAIDHSA